MTKKIANLTAPNPLDYSRGRKHPRKVSPGLVKPTKSRQIFIQPASHPVKVG
jgi:hypothetical protein